MKHLRMVLFSSFRYIYLWQDITYVMIYALKHAIFKKKSRINKIIQFFFYFLVKHQCVKHKTERILLIYIQVLIFHCTLFPKEAEDKKFILPLSLNTKQLTDHINIICHCSIQLDKLFQNSQLLPIPLLLPSGKYSLDWKNVVQCCSTFQVMVHLLC